MCVGAFIPSVVEERLRACENPVLVRLVADQPVTISERVQHLWTHHIRDTVP